MRVLETLRAGSTSGFTGGGPATGLDGQAEADVGAGEGLVVGVGTPGATKTGMGDDGISVKFTPTPLEVSISSVTA